MKKILSMALAVALVLGLAAPAVAAGQTFSDVPESYWGYADIEAVAEAGLMNGTGGGAFSPEMKVSVAQFLTLLGRLVFPDVKTEGADWFGPYIAMAQEAGLLAGTQVDTGNVEAEISRYDMAVILRAAGKKLGVTEKTAQSSEVTDYGMVPTMYADAVLAVYGMGLIRGDQAGNFNGGNTMMRAEVATVIMRLKKAAPGGSQGETTEPTTPPEPSSIPEVTPSPTPERPPELKTVKFGGWMKYGTNGDPEEKGTGVEGVPFQLRYTEDNGATYTVIAEDVTRRSWWYGDDTPGYFEFTAEIDENLYNDIEAGKGQLYVSAETTVNGQRYVTQDRRTDGKATIVSIGKNWTRFFVDLVPPDRGETVDITVVGSVTAHTYVHNPDGSGYVKTYSSYYDRGNDFRLTDSTVRIYYDSQQSGAPLVLIGETTADGGQFHDTISIDTAYYRTTGAHYVVKIEARLDGQLCVNSTSSQAPITLSELTGKRAVRLWGADSDEYFEDYLGHPRP